MSTSWYANGPPIDSKGCTNNLEVGRVGQGCTVAHLGPFRRTKAPALLRHIRTNRVQLINPLLTTSTGSDRQQHGRGGREMGSLTSSIDLKKPRLSSSRDDKKSGSSRFQVEQQSGSTFCSLTRTRPGFRKNDRLGPILETVKPRSGPGMTEFYPKYTTTQV